MISLHVGTLSSEVHEYGLWIKLWTFIHNSFPQSRVHFLYTWALFFRGTRVWSLNKTELLSVTHSLSPVYIFSTLRHSFFLRYTSMVFTNLIQRPWYQRGSPRQNPIGNWTTRRPPDDRKETQTAVVWSCFPFTRSGKNHLARHSERGEKTRQTEEEMWRNIRKWTGLEFRKSQRTVENRENWENWLQNHLWCPNDPRG